MNDLRYALRSVTKSPGFTAVVVLTLALGIGVNSTVFLIVSDLFLRPLAVKDPDRLVYVMQQSPRFGLPLGFSFPDYRDLSAAIAGNETRDTGMASAFAGLLAYRQMPVALSRSGIVTERTWIAAVSNNFFDVIGVGAKQGRVFGPGESGESRTDPVVVLTHAYWMKRFRGDPDIVGQTITMNSLAVTVIGVTTPGFGGPQWTDALSGFVPFTLLPQLQPADAGRLENRGQLGNMVMGRLCAGATLDQASAAANVMLARLIQQYPAEHPPATALVVSERLCRPAPAATGYTPVITAVLMLGALLVLVVALANVINLLFARAVDRQRELAVRTALGASRSRLIRQLLLETSVLALAAGGLGLLLAQWAGDWLGRFVARIGDVPPAAERGADWRIFAFTVGLALFAGIFAALAPALKATRHALVPLLNAGGATTAGSRQRLRALLLVLQVAVSSVVLFAAGLGVRSAYALTHVDPGFQPANLLLASYDLGLQRYVARNGFERAQQFHPRLLERVRALPGVSSASLASHVPFDSNASFEGQIVAEGAPPAADPRAPLIPVEAVDHAYLHTMGIPLRSGRDFAATDNAASPRVAIINEAMARRLWPALNSSNRPDAAPLGKHLLIGGGGSPIEVVGVIGNGRYMALGDANRPHVFLPLAQNFRGAVTLVVRTEANPLALGAAIEKIVRSMEPDLPLYNVRSMEQQLAGSPMGLMPIQFGATLIGAQGLLVLLLTLTGIYGMVAFGVARRTREIGVRIALGATPVNVTRLVTQQSLKLTIIGSGCGLLLALGLMRPLAGLLYGVSPTDAGVFTGVVLLVSAIALLACWLPARRATRISPVEALRAE